MEANRAGESHKELETLVIVHDQQVLLDCEQQSRFSSLRRYRYLFVGMGSTDLVSHRDDVIVARLLPDNIEHYPNLLSFTGWYAVARNQLAEADRVALLEYDVTIAAGLERATLMGLAGKRSIVGYVPHSLTHPMYLHGTPWFTESLATTYGLDVPDMVREHLARGGADQWTATTNHALRIDDLVAFVDWFTPLTEQFRHDPIGAGVHERAISIFCLLNGVDISCVGGVLEHAQAESHGIAAVPGEEAQRLADESSPLVPPDVVYARLLESERALAVQTERAEGLEQTLADQVTRTEKLEQLNDALVRSRSWRLLGPMRSAGRALRRVPNRRLP